MCIHSFFKMIAYLFNPRICKLESLFPSWGIYNRSARKRQHILTIHSWGTVTMWQWTELCTCSLDRLYNKILLLLSVSKAPDPCDLCLGPFFTGSEEKWAINIDNCKISTSPQDPDYNWVPSFSWQPATTVQEFYLGAQSWMYSGLFPDFPRNIIYGLHLGTVKDSPVCERAQKSLLWWFSSQACSYVQVQVITIICGWGQISNWVGHSRIHDDFNFPLFKKHSSPTETDWVYVNSFQPVQRVWCLAAPALCWDIGNKKNLTGLSRQC